MIKFYLILASLILILGGCNRDESVEVQTNYDTQTSTETEETSAELQTYQNEKLGISFDHQASWELLGDVDYSDDGSFFLEFDTSGSRLMIYGVNAEYVRPQAPLSDIEQCALNSNADEFCENGCEKVNDNVALKYKTSRNGDYGFNGFAYTSLSQKYPAICFQLDLSQVLDEIAEEKGIKYSQVSQNYDVESFIKNREVSEQILQVVDEFERLIETIKPN